MMMCGGRYGFENEVLRKYDARVLSIFMKVFQELPCGAVIRNVPPRAAGTVSSASTVPERRTRKGGNRTKKNTAPRQRQAQSGEGEGWQKAPIPGETRTIVVHGGLFRSWSSMKRGSMMLGDLRDLAEWNRQSPDPENSVIEDVLWSDPQVAANDVSPNKLRGAGVLYGKGAVQAFFKRNNLHGLIRAHEGPDMREKRPEMNDMLAGYSIDMELINGFVATVFSSALYRTFVIGSPILDLHYLRGDFSTTNSDMCYCPPFFCLPSAPDNPRENKGAFATLHGKESKRMQVLPEFTTFEKPKSPGDFVLFYKPEDSAQPATPRTSFS